MGYNGNNERGNAYDNECRNSRSLKTDFIIVSINGSRKKENKGLLNI